MADAQGFDEQLNGIREKVAKVRKSADGAAVETPVEPPPAAPPTLTEVAKAQLETLRADIAKHREALEGVVTKSAEPVAEHVEITKNLAAAEAKIAQVASVLNLDPQDDDLRWKIGSAVCKLKEYAELMRLLGETTFKADSTMAEVTKSETPVAKSAFWPSDLAGTRGYVDFE